MHAHATVARGCIHAVARSGGGRGVHRGGATSQATFALSSRSVAGRELALPARGLAAAGNRDRKARGLLVRVAADDTTSPSEDGIGERVDEEEDEQDGENEEDQEARADGHSGLAFVLEAAEAVAQETEEEKAVDRRKRYLELGTLDKEPEKDETCLEMGSDSERRPYLTRIVAAYQSADPGSAVEALDDLKASGYRAGPKAYHGVVTSCVSAGDMDGALDWLLVALEAGEQPLPQTFVALSRAFIKTGQVVRAEQMVKAMAKSGFSKQNAWMVLVANLLQEGYLAEGERHMHKGLKAKFRPTVDLYRLWVEALCQQGRVTEVLKIVPDIRGTTGQLPTAEIYAPIIESLVAIDATEAAFRTLVGMFQRVSDPISPNSRCFNALLRGMSRIESTDPEDAARILEVQGMMNQFGIDPDFETVTFCTEGLINAGAFGIAYTTYEDLRKVATSGSNDEGFKASVRLHEDGLMTQMMDGLAELKSIDFLVECAKGAARDGCQLGQLEPDSDGRTFVTRWVKDSVRFKAETMEREMWISHKRYGKNRGAGDGEDWTYVPGLKAASKMTVGELREELEGYCLPIEGLRKEVYDRLQEARRERKIKPQPKGRAGGAKKKKPATKEEREAAEMVSSRWVAGRRVKVIEGTKNLKLQMGPSQSTIMSGRADTEMVQVVVEEEEGGESAEGGADGAAADGGAEEGATGELQLPDWMETEDNAVANRSQELALSVELLQAVREAGGVVTAQDCQMLVDSQLDIEPGPVRDALGRALVGAVRDAAEALVEEAAARGMSTSAGASLFNRAIRVAVEMGDAELCVAFAEGAEAVGVEPDQMLMTRALELSG